MRLGKAVRTYVAGTWYGRPTTALPSPLCDCAIRVQQLFQRDIFLALEVPVPESDDITLGFIAYLWCAIRARCTLVPGPSTPTHVGMPSYGVHHTHSPTAFSHQQTYTLHCQATNVLTNLKLLPGCKMPHRDKRVD